MASIIISGKWTRQPQGTVELDRTHPLVEAGVFDNHILLPDGIANKGFTKAGTIEPSAAVGGIGLRGDGSTGRYSKTISELSNTPQVLYASFTTSDTTGGIIHSVSTTDPFSAFAYLYHSSVSGKVGAAYRFVNGGTSVAVLGPTLEAGATYNIVAVLRSRFAADNVVYVNGVAYYPTVNTTEGSDTWLNETIASRNYQGTYDSFSTATIHITGRYSGLLSSNVGLIEWSANPWQIFRKRPQILYFDVGGGGATDSAADSSSFAITGSAAQGTRTLQEAANSSSFAITGSAANGIRAKKSAADSGSLVITAGTAAALRTFAGVATAGTVVITGTDAVGNKTGAADTPSAASSGSFVITGTAALGIRTLRGVAETGTISVTGSAAEGLYTPLGATPSAADSGSISITAGTANGIRALQTAAGFSSISITGSAAVGAKTKASAAGSGVFEITAGSALASRTYQSAANGSSFAITAGTAVGAKGGGSIALSPADIAAIVDAMFSDPRMLTLPKWLALR